MKIEGKYDKDGDGNFEGNFAYHIGTDLYAQYTLALADSGKGDVLHHQYRPTAFA
jgi:hypothetical protein